MKQIWWCALAATLAALVGRGPAEAQQPALEVLKGLQLSGYLEAAYLYNFENPSSRLNELRIFDDKSNDFTFHMAELSLTRPADETVPVGFGLVLNIGRDARKTHAAGLGEASDVFDLQQGYVTYTAPVGRGLTLKFGKFATLLGGEVIEAPANPNFSRSFLFGFAIPFTHVGVLASYPFTEQVSASLGVVNGWDNADDNNTGKSLLGQLAVSPAKDLSLSLNGILGPEQDDDSSHQRWVLDLVATYAGLKPLIFSANVDYGREAKVPALGGKDATWWGVGGIVSADLTDRLGVALRGERFLDDDGVRTGFGSRLKLWEVTATASYKLFRSLTARLEFRHDQADQKAFLVKDDVPRKKSQDTIALELFYTF